MELTAARGGLGLLREDQFISFFQLFFFRTIRLLFQMIARLSRRRSHAFIVKRIKGGAIISNFQKSDAFTGGLCFWQFINLRR